jgi:hypothetical protein
LSGNGNHAVSNSLGAGGTLPHAGGWDKYVNTGMNYGKYNGYGCEAGHTKVQADSSNADPYDASTEAPPNPWVNCGHDPNGFAIVNHASGGIPGTWNADRSHALGYSVTANAYAFNFSGSTGFTSDINIGYTNNNTTTQSHVSGNWAPVQDSSYLYSA